MPKEFPNMWEAPRDFLFLEGNCGPLAIWGVLNYFNKQASYKGILKASRHTKKYGVFTIWLALALHEFDLSVKIFSDPDPNPKAIERVGYRLAAKNKIKVEKIKSLNNILNAVKDNTIAIVFYNTDVDEGHFSPLLGVKRGRLILPYSENGIMSRKEFLRRWRSPGIFRQCILVSSINKTGNGI